MYNRYIDCLKHLILNYMNANQKIICLFASLLITSVIYFMKLQFDKSWVYILKTCKFIIVSMLYIWLISYIIHCHKYISRIVKGNTREQIFTINLIKYTESYLVAILK